MQGIKNRVMHFVLPAATCVYRCRSLAGPAVPDVISRVFPHNLSCRSPCGAAALMNYAAPSPELGSREKCILDFGRVASAQLLATPLLISPNV